jgi:RNA polymerase sigma factor (sigma-70 family)
LNLYNNRNDGIFIVLLHLLEELNTREYLAEGIYKATALSCFYNKYINSNGSGKRVSDTKKEKEYCIEVFEYIVSYSSIYKIKYGYDYQRNLRHRLDMLKEMKLDEVFVGLEEVGISYSGVKKLKSLGYLSLSDLLRKYYKSNGKMDSDILDALKIAIKNDILSPIYNREKALKGEICLENVYALVLTLIYKGSDENTENYKDNIYIGPKSKETYEYICKSLLSTLTPREREVMLCRYGLKTGKFMSLEEIGREYCVTRIRVKQIEDKALRSLRHPSNLNKLNKEFVIEYAKTIE